MEINKRLCYEENDFGKGCLLIFCGEVEVYIHTQVFKAKDINLDLPELRSVMERQIRRLFKSSSVSAHSGIFISSGQ